MTAESASDRPVRVLATRPRAQNAGWCQRLREAGLAVLELPMLEIQPVQEPAQRQAIKNLVLEFDQFNKVIFVSLNAVRETLAWLDDYWPQLPTGIEYFAVGETTATALSAQGIEANAGCDAMNSEELLALPALAQIADEKVLICRGCGGRPRLADELIARGAQVKLGEFYRRVLPEEAVGRMRRSDFGEAGYREVLAAFSGESLENLVRVLDGANRPDWRRWPIAVPGERVARQAREAGFTAVAPARNATEAAMLEAVQALH